MRAAVSPGVLVAMAALAAGGAAVWFVTRPAATAGSGEPRLVVAENPVVFGKRFDDEEPEVTLVLSNPGARPLRIVKFDPRCGCIRAGDTPTSIAPGAEVRLPLRIRLTGMAGPVSRSVLFETDDAASPITQVRIEGEALPWLEVEPKSLEVRPETLESAATIEFDVRGAKGRKLKDLTATSTIRGFGATVVAQGSQAHVHVDVAPFADDFQSSIVLRAGRSERFVPVTGIASRDVRAEPSRLTLGRGNRGETLEARLSGRHGVEWRVRSVETDRKDLVAEVVDGVLRVRIAADAPPGEFVGAVTVMLEGAKPDRVRVPVTAFLEK